MFTVATRVENAKISSKEWTGTHLGNRLGARPGRSSTMQIHKGWKHPTEKHKQMHMEHQQLDRLMGTTSKDAR